MRLFFLLLLLTAPKILAKPPPSKRETLENLEAKQAERQEIANAWTRVFNALDGYKYYYENVQELLYLQRHGATVDQEVLRLSIPDQNIVRVGWTHHQHIGEHLAGFHKRIEKFFRSQSTIMKKYDRTNMEIGVWLPGELPKIEKFLHAFLEIPPLKLNMKAIRKALLTLSSLSNRIEVIYILDAMERLQGLQNPMAPRGLIEKTKNAVKGYSVTKIERNDSNKKQIKFIDKIVEVPKKKKADCDPMFYLMVYISSAGSLVISMVSVIRMQVVIHLRNRIRRLEEKLRIQRMIFNRKD
ncbi:unnamed protein product [Caenorhabditis brenneri]